MKTREKLKQLAFALWQCVVALVDILKAIYMLFIKQHRIWNEAWLLVVGVLLWKYSEVVIAWVDPTAPPLPVNDLMRFLYATIGTFVAHFVVTIMLRMSHPIILQYLYSLFINDLYEANDLKSQSLLNEKKCIRLKYSLYVWLVYLATWLILAATY